MEPQVNYDQRYSGLLTVYRLRSFAAAAVELSLTASAVSERELEKRLVQKGTLPADAADAVAIALCHARSATSLIHQQERFDPCSTI